MAPDTDEIGRTGSSRWRVIATTPMRDLLRGRATGRLDWQGAVQSAGLPLEIERFLLKTIRKTRLTRLEKAGVADGLVEHTRSRLARGDSADQILHDLGSSRNVARQIRRDRLKQRPFLSRFVGRRLRVIRYGLLVSVGLYVVLAVRLYTGRPQINRNFVAEFNAKVAAIPESERAWSVYREAMLLSEVVPKPWGDIDAVFAKWPDVPVVGPEALPIVAYLDRNRAAVETAWQAADRASLGLMLSDAADRALFERESQSAVPTNAPNYVASVNPFYLDISMAHLGALRELSRLLQADARLAASRGESDRVERDIATMMASAQHIRDCPEVISDLTSIAIAAHACATMAEVCGEHPGLLAERHLSDLSRLLCSLGDHGSMRVRLAGERIFLSDFAQRVFTDDGNGDGRITFEGLRFALVTTGKGEPDLGYMLLAPMGTLNYGSRREFESQFERVLRLFEQQAAAAPVRLQPQRWECGRQLDALVTAPRPLTVHRMVYAVMPAIVKTYVASEQFEMDRAGTLAGIAVERYRIRAGHYPESLGDLVLDLLPAIPDDWIDGKPIRYRVVGGRGTVYSVGPDRDDDGGHLPADGYTGELLHWISESEAQAELRNPNRAARLNGDWVIWPRWSRSLEAPDTAPSTPNP